MSIGENIKALRTRLGLSQSEFARMVNVTPQCICRIEKANRSPSVPVIVSIATKFNVTTDSLIFGTLNYHYNYNMQKEVCEE